MAPKEKEVVEDMPIVETPKEQSVPLSEVQALIEKALASFKESEKPVKPKRVTEHTAHIWRFDGKWVTDFKDRNTDEYLKEKVHAFQKFNEQLRQFQPWIELVFEDGTTKEIPHNTYMKNRTPHHCPIIKRHQVDKTYAIGEVEKKKEVGAKLVGTGVMIDQEVVMVGEVFDLRIPDGKIISVPDYVLA